MPTNTDDILSRIVRGARTALSPWLAAKGTVAVLATVAILFAGVGDAFARRTKSFHRFNRYRAEQRAKSSLAPDLREPDDIDEEQQQWEEWLQVRSAQEIMQELDSTAAEVKPFFNPLRSPMLFRGYMNPPEPLIGDLKPLKFKAPYIATDSIPNDTLAEPIPPVTLPKITDAYDITYRLLWLRHKAMLERPEIIEQAVWLLPDPPQLPPEDYSFSGYMKRLKLPTVNGTGVNLNKRHIERINWLHVFNGGIQFSQAYLSKNWYQGGNDYLALLINIFWNVKLNEAYHPNLLFENTVSYKLGLNSNSQDEYHKYSISEDLFQWNMNFGLKASNKWYYSLTSQFKTQLLNSYPENSLTRTAAFLSPGELNVGLGMTYSTQNRHKTFRLKVAVSPASYNLKLCLDRQVDPTQFGIKAGRRVSNEIGSSAEVTVDWNITGNISYRTRLFAFSDYRNYHHDWENTLSFTINRFLSTQIYANLRYDTSGHSLNRWGHWMLKEILSFGFSYAFSTK